MSRKFGIKMVCTNDVHFLDEDNADAHELLICLSTGRTPDDPNLMRYSKQEWFKTTQEMNALFEDVPEALQGTVEILDKSSEQRRSTVSVSQRRTSLRSLPVMNTVRL